MDETTPDSAYLEELIKRGETFEVFVPEIKALKVVSIRIRNMYV